MDARQALLLMAGGESYQEAVLSLSPVGYWPLGEATPGTGVCRDLTGANNGTYVGSPTGGVAGPLVGDASTAVTFNGTSQYVNCGAAAGFAFLGRLPYTAAVWQLVPDWAGNTQGLLGRRTTGSVGWGIGQQTDADALKVNSWRGTDNVKATNLVSGTGWSFAVARYDGTTLGIFVDGTWTEMASSVNLTDSGTNLTIGRRGDSVFCTKGSLAHAAIWARALTDAEVADLYAVGKGTA